MQDANFDLSGNPRPFAKKVRQIDCFSFQYHRMDFYLVLSEFEEIFPKLKIFS